MQTTGLVKKDPILKEVELVRTGIEKLEIQLILIRKILERMEDNNKCQ